MAAELKQVKGCLVSQEQFFVNKSLSRKKTLEDRNCLLEASSSAATKVLTLTYPFVF
uniref:Uncharacterized protein n=1 Tax=Brassica oleracea var. oleracea TaxID=109376 RepID=A0A0D3C0B6_BRAOL